MGHREVEGEEAEARDERDFQERKVRLFLLVGQRQSLLWVTY